jgi:AmmeMemoRadiSam system protein B
MTRRRTFNPVQAHATYMGVAPIPGNRAAAATPVEGRQGETAMASIREPAVAGSFYPDDPVRLRDMVQAFLAKAEDGRAGVPATSPPKALIAPHAGYVYSGVVAGRAFASLRSSGPIGRVVMIGPAHRVPIRGLAVDGHDAYRTPLGDVPLDRAAIGEIQSLPQVQVTSVPHRDEHALEVELPFLQLVLGDFTLVPLVVGDARADQVAEVLEGLWDGAATLIVVSSDLSHYHDYGRAKHLDLATAEAIERFDGGALGPEDACGHLAIAGLLDRATHERLGVRRLDLRSSGDTAGPKSQVVGYGAWAFDA